MIRNVHYICSIMQVLARLFAGFLCLKLRYIFVIFCFASSYSFSVSWLHHHSLSVSSWLHRLTLSVPSWLHLLTLSVSSWLHCLTLSVPTWLHRLLQPVWCHQQSATLHRHPAVIRKHQGTLDYVQFLVTAEQLVWQNLDIVRVFFRDIAGWCNFRHFPTEARILRCKLGAT